MEQLYKTSFLYLILGLISGVFYREFTKILNFEGITSLSKVHPHLLLLGFLFFLSLIFIEKSYNIRKNKRFNLFYNIYNLGLLLTSIFMVWRGILDVLGKDSKMVSGMAGLGHILLGIGLIMFTIIIKENVVQETIKN